MNIESYVRVRCACGQRTCVVGSVRKRRAGAVAASNRQPRGASSHDVEHRPCSIVDAWSDVSSNAVVQCVGMKRWSYSRTLYSTPYQCASDSACCHRTDLLDIRRHVTLTSSSLLLLLLLLLPCMTVVDVTIPAAGTTRFISRSPYVCIVLTFKGH